MKTQTITCGLFTLALLTTHALAQPRALLLPPNAPTAAVKEQSKQKDKDKEKDKDKKLTEPPKTDIFTPVTSAVGDYPSMFNPQMMGDKQIYFARMRLALPATVTTSVTGIIPSTQTTVNVATGTQTRDALVPAPHRGAFNIAENGSPMPIDRVFVFWHHFRNVGFPTGANAPTATFNNQITVGTGNRIGQVTSTDTLTVIQGAPRVDIDREVFGFEKTFLDGYASIELRAPLVHQGGGGANFGVNAFGDLTIIGKYALYLDRAQNNVISTGLGVTVPTGRSIYTVDGRIHDVLLQPYVGVLWNFDRFYVQGFTSVVIPTDSQDVVQMFNSFGINYWLYRGGPDRLLSFVVPSVEAHVTTPLNQRDYSGPIVVPDAVVLTGGVHLGLFRNTTLTVGAGAPVTGPRPFSVEGFVQLNVRY